MADPPPPPPPQPSPLPPNPTQPTTTTLLANEPLPRSREFLASQMLYALPPELSPSQLHIDLPQHRTPGSGAISTTSTLTASVHAATAPPASNTPTPKHQKTSLSLFHESPSPNRHNPDFNMRRDGDSVMSGDNSTRWAEEERQMEGLIAAQNACQG